MNNAITPGRWRRLLGVLIGCTISLSIGLVLLEIGCMILARTGYIPARLPTYTLPKAEKPFLMDMNPHFGVWHAGNTSLQHTKKCFDVTYRTNSYGAVDRERTMRSDTKRAVVLGDSFVEGYGVEAADRFSDRLEKKTGVPQLNFGTSGYFGPTQYYLVYEHLARQFDHDDVLVAIFPGNDFRDDYPRAGRYQPYWAGTYPDYSLRYSVDSISASKMSPDRVRGRARFSRYPRNFTHMYNVFDWSVSYLSYKRGAARLRTGVLDEAYSGYFDFTPEELQRMRFSLERIRELAVDKRMIVFTIPRLNDFIRYRAAGGAPLGGALLRIADEVGFDYLDLLPAMYEPFEDHWDDLFHTCDGHFSKHGHEAAAGLLQQRFYPSHTALQGQR